MTPKVKAQKTRLSNYLVKELGAKLQKSQSTESEYYQLGPVKIRISDHTTRRNNQAINIFIPFNDPNTFMVENNYTISVLKSLKEVKTFLHSLIFIHELYAEAFKTDVHQELSKVKNDLDELKVRNAELESMVETRNNAIDELSRRAKAAETIALSDPEKASSLQYMFAGNVITLSGISYSMDQFPSNFVTKARNIVANSSGKIKPL